MREEMLATVSGAQLAEIRKQLGLTQTQLAEAAGLSQARISQIENGSATSLETLRAYVAGLGGHLDIVARIGNSISTWHNPGSSIPAYRPRRSSPIASG
jgi:transcriptional regulator with XRE-family HTH domain